MKVDRRAQIKNIASTLLPASHRTDDTVTAFGLGFALGMNVGRRAAFVSDQVLNDLRATGEGLEMDLRSEAIVRLLKES